VYEETLTGLPHDTSVQKATSDNENVDAVYRHVLDAVKLMIKERVIIIIIIRAFRRQTSWF